MARTTISDLAQEIRAMTMLGTADFTNGTMNFWDDDQIQRVLDKYRTDIYREELHKIEKPVGSGSVEYYEYQSFFRNFEKTDGGSVIFIIEDGAGNDQGTVLWSADYIRGRITFASNTGGSTYYLTGRSYDLNRAAADIARKTANHYNLAIDISTPGHRLMRSQLRKQFQEMAAEFDRQSGLGSWGFTDE